MTRAARQRQQDAWQAGVDWCARERLVRRARAACADLRPYDQHLFLQGVCNILTAEGRKIAGLDGQGKVRP